MIPTPPVQKGQVVELVQMLDDPCRILPGDKGVVRSVTRLPGNNWQIHVAWESGRRLALLHPTDLFKVIS